MRFLHYVITMPAFQADRLGCSIQEVYIAIETKNLYKRGKLISAPDNETAKKP